MRKVRLGRTNIQVTRWGLGGIPLSPVMGGTTDEAINEVIHATLDKGINIIDTAKIYMGSEANIGEVMKTRRSECVLASKSFVRDAEGMTEDILDSLEELHTEKIEIYQLHDVRPPDVPEIMGKGGALEALKKARDEGLIDHIGLTTHHVQVGIDLLKTDEFATIMIPFNVIEREPEKELLSLVKEKDVGFIVMKPIAGGAIADIEKAFRFFNAYPVDLILNGVANLKELEGNIQCAQDDRPLTVKELADFEREVAPLGEDFCRRCGYCMPCPNDIVIPVMVHVMYSTYKGKKYEDLPPEKQEAGKGMVIWLECCDECGQCEDKCPYGLPTIERKREALEWFRNFR